jgi:hypothetical protein
VVQLQLADSEWTLRHPHLPGSGEVTTDVARIYEDTEPLLRALVQFTAARFVVP